jgi:hypothetical protein
MPQLVIPPGYRERKAAEAAAKEKRLAEIEREIQRETAKLYQERVEAVDQDDPMRSAFTALKRQAGGKEFTYLGRVVSPGETFEDVIEKIPAGELETGALVARGLSTRLLTERGTLRGRHLLTHLAAQDPQSREALTADTRAELAELGAAIQKGFESQPELIKRVVRLLIGSGATVYEDLQHLARGERPPSWSRGEASTLSERLRQIEDRARDVGWNR